MANNIVGSVAAEITLDTEQFEEAIKKLKGDVEDIKQTFNKKTGGKNGLVDEVTKLKEEIDSLKGKISDYKNSIKTLRDENSKYVKEIEKLNKQLDASKKSHADNVKQIREEQSVLESAAKSAEKYALKTEKIGKRNTYKKPSASDFKSGTWTVNPELQDQVKLETLKNGYFEYDRMVRESVQKEKLAWQTRQSNMRNAMEAYVSMVRNMVIQQKRAFASDGGYNNYLNTLSKVQAEFGKINNVNFTKLSDNIYKNGQLVLNWGASFSKVQSELAATTTGYNKLMDTVIRTSDVLKTFNFTLMQGIEGQQRFTNHTLKLASAMHKLSTQGTANWSGRQTTGGYSNYISQSGQIANTLKRQAQSAKEAKYAVEGLSQAYSKINLNSYKSNINQINQALEQQRFRTLQLEAAQASLYYKNAPNNLNTYKMNMDQINQSLERQTGIHQKNNNEIKRGQMSMREFGTTMGKAEAYSNNLYRGLQKVRSVIVSFKTIMGAMGGMAVWSFAADLIEGAKETYKSKSEMESLLRKNDKVSADGILTFNKALDDTISKFQRINKYSLGETAASIGLEFNLSAKEMAKSLNSIAMIQNEYARAGRTNEEAALAVKDILQGEFRRLSMETGIGEKELTGKYGWNGKKEDVMDLMKALEKAGKDRHWDLFAEKATSVGDVVNITKSRFSEFGADLITNAEPMIVGAFNGMLDVINSLTNAFEGMGSFGKIFTIGATGATAFTGISTALMMFKRNMGLAEIATLGWGKSFGTALMGLNKTDVALHGFWKTLLATISGTEAATVANTGFGKSLVARLLGVKANIAGEEGFLKAIMVSQGALRGESEIMTLTAASGLTLSQRLAAVTNNLSATEVKGWGLRKSLMSVVTSTKLLKIALLGLTSVAILAWFAGVAAEADRVKKIIEGSNKVASEGKDIAKDAQENVDKLTDKLSGLTEGTKKYKKVQGQLKIAKWNKEDIDSANKLVKSYKKLNKERKEGINERAKDRLNDSYKLAGLDDQAAAKATTGYEAQVKAAQEIRNKALTEYDNRLYKASQHMNEHVQLMKESGAKQEDMVKYITEYNAESRNTAKLWKKFNEGDLQSGFYAMMSELKLLWIDLWNNNHFVNFWNSLKNTWEDIKPTVYAIKDTFLEFGNLLLDFFSTKQGQIIGGITATGLAFGFIGTKLYHILGGTKSTIDILKTVGGKLKDIGKGWKKAGDEAEEATEKMGGGKSTGGIKGEKGKGSWWKTDALKSDVQNYTRAAVGIAAGMLLMSEAILMLNLPMTSLAATGYVFKQVEPYVRGGIEGLKLIAPTMLVLLPPVIALSYLFGKYNVEVSTIVRGAGRAAVGIAVGMLLVTEAIAMLNAPLLAIASLGYTFNWQKDAVLKGREAINIVTDCLVSLAPTIPLFIGGIALMAVAIAAPEIGIPALAATALGIGAAMLLTAEAVVGLNVPLAAIAQTGQNYPDLSSVEQGAKALKITAKALGYVEDAVNSFVGITWASLKEGIARLGAEILDINLTDLTGEGGFFQQINDFIKDFNQVTVEPIDSDKVDTLSTSADGISSIGTAMEKVQTAMDSIPNEFKGKVGDRLGLTGNNTNGTATQTQSVDVQGYFDTFKEPIKQLKTFIYDFNHSEDFNIEPIDTDKVANISSAASMIETVNGAVEKVKTVMGNIAGGQWNTAQAEGGILSAVGNWLYHATGANTVNNGQSTGDYKSSLGGQLKQMEDVVSDLFTFQSNISQYGSSGEGGADVGGVANMVTVIQTAISNVSTALSNAVPTFEGHGNAMSSAIVKGFNSGLNALGNIPAKIANKIMNDKETLYATATSLGKTTYTKFKEGVNPMSDAMGWELYYVNQQFATWDPTISQSAYNLGQHASDSYKNGLDMHSPGLMARATQEEVGYIGDALSVNNLPQLAMDLGNALTNNFNVDFNFDNIQLPNLDTFKQGISTVVPAVKGMKDQVSANFRNMQTNVGGAFTNIVSKTRASLTNMKTATLNNIGNIKTSWSGMQSALIASAEHIKSQTTSKINTLKDNLGKFWQKIKNPELLIGSAGGHTGSIRRRNIPIAPRGNYAGGFNFKPKISRSSPSDDGIGEYLKCLLETGKPCYAGGWNFNWTPKISKKFKGWKTNFNKFHLDDYLNVGKFEHSNFPVKGNAEVAKAYIFDVIRATSYDKYFDSKFNDDPVSALRAGAFNCWDGTNIVLALASAFGFSGSRGHGTWNGIGHVWANIPGLGIIDPTAIQNRGTFTSSAVKGYNAGGSIRRSSPSVPPEQKETQHNEVHIHINGDVYGIDDLNSKIEEGAKRVARNLFRDRYSGV